MEALRVNVFGVHVLAHLHNFKALLLWTQPAFCQSLDQFQNQETLCTLFQIFELNVFDFQERVWWCFTAFPHFPSFLIILWGTKLMRDSGEQVCGLFSTEVPTLAQCASVGQLYFKKHVHLSHRLLTDVIINYDREYWNSTRCFLTLGSLGKHAH